MGITTNDLAKMCGVSRTTVVRALNNTGRINEATKAMIIKTAQENGYKPDLLAKSLAKGKTNSIGMIVLDCNSRYFAKMISTVSAEAEKFGYGVSISLHQNEPQKEIEKLNRMASYKMDGVILSSVNEGDKYRKYLEDLGIPVVSVDNKIADGIPFVEISQSSAMEAATERVLEKGYNNLIFVCPPINGNIKENTYVHKRRLEGFNRALEGRKENVSYLLDWGYLKNLESMDIDKDTAIVCTSDEIALEIMSFLKGKGLKAGVHYGIQGFDSIDTLKYISPALCTVNNNVETVAKEALNLLMKLISDEKNVETKETVVVPYELIDGETL